MRFTERDGQILDAIHAYDGVLARRQIKQLFWPESSWRVLHRRLAYLHYHSYIAKPDLDDRKIRPIPEPVVWINWRGALHLAGKSGIKVQSPNGSNEYQIRKLRTQLRKSGFRWLREPNWSQLSHDLTVVDIRLALQNACVTNSDLEITEWVNESVFRANPDVIEIINRYKSNTRKIKRGVIPDGAFLFSDLRRKRQEKPYKGRFLLELDMASHDNSSFGMEKAAVGVAYVKSDAYRKRFGSNSGRWLVVTTGSVRMKNLIKQTKQCAGDGANLFFFSTLDLLEEEDPFISPVWFKVMQDEPVSLLSG